MLTSEEEKKTVNQAAATAAHPHSAEEMKPNVNEVSVPKREVPQAPPEDDEDEMEVVSRDTVDRERLLKTIGAAVSLAAVVAAGGFLVYWLCKRRGLEK